MLISVFHWVSTLCSAASAAASAAVWAFVATEVENPSQNTNIPAASRPMMTRRSKGKTWPCSSLPSDLRLRIPVRSLGSCVSAIHELTDERYQIPIWWRYDSGPRVT